MRNMFPGHFKTKKEEFDLLWEEATFVFDTNVLLNPYRYTEATQTRLFDILDRLKERIWVPHQVAQEYVNGRLGVIFEQTKIYEDVLRKIDGIRSIFPTRHAFIDSERLVNVFTTPIEHAKREVQEAQSKYKDLLAEDWIAEQIADLFTDKVGSKYSPERLTEIYQEGETRYEAKIPPGFGDVRKPVPGRYGDLVIWNQLIDYAIEHKTPLVLITDDHKEDWWWRYEGRTLGPRPELIAEFLARSSCRFYMYQQDNFMERAQSFLRLQAQQEVIKEVQEVSRRTAQLQITLDDELMQRKTDETSAAVMARRRERLLRHYYESIIGSSKFTPEKQALYEKLLQDQPAEDELRRQLELEIKRAELKGDQATVNELRHHLSYFEVRRDVLGTQEPGISELWGQEERRQYERQLWLEADEYRARLTKERLVRLDAEQDRAHLTRERQVRPDPEQERAHGSSLSQQRSADKKNRNRD